MKALPLEQCGDTTCLYRGESVVYSRFLDHIGQGRSGKRRRFVDKMAGDILTAHFDKNQLAGKREQVRELKTRAYETPSREKCLIYLNGLKYIAP